MIAVDVNIIAYWFIAGEKTTDAQELRKLDPEWLVPDLWRDEFLNILTSYVRQGGTTLETAKQLWLSAIGLLAVGEQTADPLVTLETAKRYQVSAYNAQYLTLAIQSGVQLITEDKALRRAAPQHCQTMQEFIAAAGESSSDA